VLANVGTSGAAAPVSKRQKGRGRPSPDRAISKAIRALRFPGGGRIFLSGIPKPTRPATS